MDSHIGCVQDSDCFSFFCHVFEAPAAFAGIIYIVVRQKYFVGYMGQTSQR